jgi:integrase
MSGFGVFGKLSGILAANPCSQIRRTHHKKDEPAHLDAPEAHRMLEAVRGHRLEGAVLLGLVGGLRLAEVCGARWADVNGETLYVRRSFYGPTKSGEPRSLALPAEALERMRRYKVHQAEDLLRFGVAQDESTPILATWVGRAMNPNTLAWHFRRFCAEYGFRISFHGLRHSCAIGMLSSGVDVKTAASRLGHSPRVLLANYAHHVKSTDEAAAERLGKWLSG